MYRLKNNIELEQSKPNDCLIARCENPITKIYEVDKDYSVQVCDYHFKHLSMSRYSS